MISLKISLERYSKLLIDSWENLKFFSEEDGSGSLEADWLQANWELLVEGRLHSQDVVLEPYGDGADCNGPSSRVLYPDRLPTHRIICKPMTGYTLYDLLNDRQLDISTQDLVFDRFVCIGDGNWYHESPPFDKVLADFGGEEVVVDIHSVDFQLQPITSS